MTRRTNDKDADRRLANIETALRRLADGGGLESVLQAQLAQMERQMEDMLTGLLTRMLGQMFGSVAGSAVGPGGGGLGEDLLGGLLGALPRFAEGGIVDAPSMLALGGEAGPEAVLPLTRMADGRLGVQAGPTGGPITINLQIGGGDADGLESDAGAAVVAALQSAVGEALDQAILDRLHTHLREGGLLEGGLPGGGLSGAGFTGGGRGRL